MIIITYYNFYSAQFEDAKQARLLYAFIQKSPLHKQIANDSLTNPEIKKSIDFSVLKPL